MSYFIIGAICLIGGIVLSYYIDIYVQVNRVIEKIKSIVGVIKN